MSDDRPHTTAHRWENNCATDSELMCEMDNVNHKSKDVKCTT